MSIYYQFIEKKYDLTVTPILRTPNEKEIDVDLVFSNRGNQPVVIYETELQGFYIKDTSLMKEPTGPIYGGGFNSVRKTVGPIFVEKGAAVMQKVKYVMPKGVTVPDKDLIADAYGNKTVGVSLVVRYDMPDGRIASQSTIIILAEVKNAKFTGSWGGYGSPVRLLPLPARAKPRSNHAF